jgi:site-specific DNA-methyltransferase (adenine-specific)
VIDLRAGDVLDRLRELPDASVDAVITDPPYGLSEHPAAELVTALTAWCNGDRERVPDGKGFMGRAWDAFVPPPAVWDECYRVLKPGGHLLAFAGSRTYDLMGLSVRLAGFEVRDGLQWLYGSGFPKGIDVGKAIDKARDGPPPGGALGHRAYSGRHARTGHLPIRPESGVRAG